MARSRYDEMPKEVLQHLQNITSELLSKGVNRPSQHNDYIRAYRAWKSTLPETKHIRGAYYRRNRERIIAHQRGYERRHVDELKEYRKKTSARRVASARAWQRANAAKYATGQKKWRLENMHIIRKHIALRRARLVNATIGNPREIAAWEKEWKSRPTNTCEWCRMEVPTSMCETDHAEPLILGGAHNLDNIVISCRPCNNRKRGKSLAKWLEMLEAGL